MTLHDEQKLIQKAMNHSLSGLQEDVWLAQRVHADTKGEKTVKRKMSIVTIMAIVLLCISATGALAAALNAWGLIDFANHRANTYVPENATAAITQENMRIETDHVICTMQESFYDGKVLYMTARVEPKEKVLLLNGFSWPTDPLSSLNPSFDTVDMSVGEYALANTDGRMAEVELNTLEGDGGNMSLAADGSLILYVECVFVDEQPERNLEMCLSYVPLMDIAGCTQAELDAGDITWYDIDALECTTFTLPLKAVQMQVTSYTDTLDFPSVGVQVTNITLRATPLELRYDIQYTVTDADKYNAQENGLWFEFIDPTSDNTILSEQRVADGLSGIGSVVSINGSNKKIAAQGDSFHQEGTIGLNTIGGQYTIRAYNCWDKTRYETVQFGE